jgi:hypothetical protein
MKIKMIHWNYSPQIGGVEAFLENVREEFVR